jgi:hypothetical protein
LLIGFGRGRGLESLCTTLFRFSLGWTNYDRRFGIGPFFASPFFLRLSRLEFWFDWIEAWVGSGEESILFFSPLEKKLINIAFRVHIPTKKTSSLILLWVLVLLFGW